jgi:hypothetical protein
LLVAGGHYLRCRSAMRLKGHSAETLRVARGSHTHRIGCAHLHVVGQPRRWNHAVVGQHGFDGPFAGAAFAALGIGLNGLLTALIVPLLAKFWS